MSAVEIEVDPHHGGIASGEEGVDSAAGAQVDEPSVGVVQLGWTPEEAGQFVCSIYNIGMVVWGPEWAAHPMETQGWNVYCAQILDQILPRGMGGAVELGVGLVMIGNGLAMMTLRRWPLIQQGPRPIWARNPQAAQQAAEQVPPQAGPAAPQATNGDGPYRLPRELTRSEIPGSPTQGI